jgi:hypothetical protein
MMPDKIPKDDAVRNDGNEAEPKPEPVNVDQLIAAYEGANVDSLRVAKQAIAAFSISSPLQKAIEAMGPMSSIAAMIEKQSRLSGMISSLVNPLPPGLTNFFASMHRVNGMSKMLEDALLPSRQMREFAAQVSAVGLPTQYPSASLALSETVRHSLLANTFDTSVARMIAGMSAHPATLTRLTEGWRNPAILESLQSSVVAPPIVEFGALERFTAVRLFRTTEEPEERSPKTEASDIIEFVQTEILDSLEAALHSVDERLVSLWRGAKEAAHTDNPDRVRQVAVSLRTIVEQLLHQLAPDKKIKGWSTSDQDYHEGRPTRRARIMFIFHSYGVEVEAFLEQDITSSIAWIDVINKQTHTLDCFKTQGAIDALLMRFESLALGLVRGARGFD